MIALQFTVFLCLVQSLLAFSPNTPQNYQQQHINSVDEDSETSRRSFLSKAAAIGASSGVLSFNPLIAKAEEGGNGNGNDGSGSEMTLFKDSNVGFQIEIPSNWKQSEQKLPDRRRLLLFVNSDESVSTGSNSKGPEDLMFVAYTPVRDDFTSLSSFGTVDQVGQATILPKGQLAGQNTDNQMLMSESKKNAYYFDYTSTAPGQPKRHFRTIFTLVQGATGGAGAVLVTITAQTLESRYDAAMKSTFDDIINSYRKL